MQKKKKSAKMNPNTARILYWGTVSVLVLIIIVCAGLIGYKLITDEIDKGDNEDLQSLKNSAAAESPSSRPAILQTTEPTEPLATDPTEQTEPTETTEPTEPPVLDNSMIFEYQALYDLNHDMVGWIQIEDTAIDYPVVQTPDSPNFYLRRNFKKESATCGTIYASGTCDINLPSDNVILYGHNMRNGTMFADLHKYKSKSFWEDHRYVFFDTLTEYRTYEIFAVFVTTADLTKGFTYNMYETFETEADFNKYVSTCKNMMLGTKDINYETDVDPVFGEKLLTLSTCDKTVDDGRLVVVARRVMLEEQ